MIAASETLFLMTWLGIYVAGASAICFKVESKMDQVFLGAMWTFFCFLPAPVLLMIATEPLIRIGILY